MANKITLLLLTLFISSTITTTSTTTISTIVYDSDGNPLEVNATYYILPAIQGHGGGLYGLGFKTYNTTKCTSFITREVLESSNGKPVKFFPLEPKQEQISLSTDLNVAFTSLKTDICVMPTVWRMADTYGKAPMPPDYVEIGASTGHPGRETVANWFKIEKAGTGEYDYKIVYCPTVCKSCKFKCGDLGIVYKSKLIVLAFSDEPHLVQFKKVIN